MIPSDPFLANFLLIRHFLSFPILKKPGRTLSQDTIPMRLKPAVYSAAAAGSLDTITYTRRFFMRPSLVPLSAMGRVRP